MDSGRFTAGYLSSFPLDVVNSDPQSFRNSSLGKAAKSMSSDELNLFTSERSNYMNMLQWDLDNQYNYQLWQEQNAYNSPAQQMQRYIEAGINPLWAISGGDPGNSQQLKSNPPSPSSYLPMTMKSDELALQSSLGNQQNAIQSLLGLGNLDIQNRNLALQERISGSSIKRTEAETRKLLSELESNEFVNRVNSATFGSQVNLKIEELNKCRAEIRELNSKSDLTDHQKSLLDAQTDKEKALKLSIQAATDKVKSETFSKIENLQMRWYELASGRISAVAAQSSAQAAQTSANASMLNAQTADRSLHHTIEKDTKELEVKSNEQILQIIDSQRGWLDRFIGTPSNVISGVLGKKPFEMVNLVVDKLKAATDVIYSRCYSDPTEANIKACQELQKRIDEFQSLNIEPINLLGLPDQNTTLNPSSSWQQ